jgi:biotin-dependent carboxylase-like uncharacterized protein
VIALEVRHPGPLTTVQDLGRRGLAGIGVTRSGAADRGSLRLANRLVGNDEALAALEVTMGGLEVEVLAPVLVAITGALCPLTVTGAPPIGPAAPGALPAGARLRLGTPHSGLRTYLAVRGGIDVAPVLGSRSHDVLAGLGPAPLQRGDRLAIGNDPGTPLVAEVAPTRPPGSVLRVWPGPRADWVAGGVRALTETTWTVRPDSNRIGVRLDGTPLRRSRAGELASEPLIEGAIQVPHDGRPIVMLADHPTTGGYPVVAVVDPADLAAVAQARPGDVLTLRPA